MIDSLVKVFRGIAKLRGNTDNELIGNTNDALKTVIQGRDALGQADVTFQNGQWRLNTTGIVQIVSSEAAQTQRAPRWQLQTAELG